MRRCAVFRPMPGSLASSVISSSIALTGQKGGANGSGGDLAHLGLQQIRGPALRFGDGGKHEVAQEFGVVPGEHGRVDDDRAHGAAAVGLDLDQAGARGGLDGTARQLGLQLLQPTLHLLAELKELLQIRHAFR